MSRARSRFYAGGPARREDGAPPGLDLAGAARLAGLEQEIGLLRALIKQAVQRNQAEEARRLVLALCGALRLQRGLTGQSDDDVGQVIGAVLDDVGMEPGQAVALASEVEGR